MSGNNLVLAGSGGGPPPPKNLLATSITNTQFTLTWDSSSVPGVTYKVYRNGTEVVGATSNTGSVISSLNGNTTYAMKVRAYLQAAYTDSASYNVLTTPNVPTGLAFSGSTSLSFVISWTSVAGLTYSIYRDSTLVTGVTPSASGTTINSSTNLSMTANTMYNMYVYAINTSGSTSSAVLTAWTLPSPPDTITIGTLRSNSASVNFSGYGGYYTAWVGSTLVPINVEHAVFLSVVITNTTGSFSYGGLGNPNYTVNAGSKVIVSGSSTGTLGGYSNPTTYYVISASSNAFTLTATRGSPTGITTSTGGSVVGLTFTHVNDSVVLTSVSINSVTTGWFTTATTTVNYYPGSVIYVYGTSPGTISGYANPTTYYIVNTTSFSNQFQLSNTFNGTPITTTASGSTSGLTFYYIKTSGLGSGSYISGLSPALDNTVYIKASNVAGTVSSAGFNIRPLPSPPTSVVVEPNNTCTFLLFNTPYDPYGVIASYTVRAYTFNGNASATVTGDTTYLASTRNTVTTVSPVCVTGLTNGTAYYYTIQGQTSGSVCTYESGPTIAGVPTVLTVRYTSCTSTIVITGAAIGWDGVKAIDICTYASSRYCGNPSFCFCISMPTRKCLTFINYGVVMGCGGNAGRGCRNTGGASGQPGCAGICVAFPLRICNFCTIGGGGGGGGGGTGWHGGGGGGGGGIPGGAGGSYGSAYRTSGNYAGSTAGTAGTSATWNSSYGYYTPGSGGNGGFGRGIGSSCNGGGTGCRGGRACTTNATDTVCCTFSGGTGGSRGGFCSTGGLGGGGGGGGGTYGGSGGTGGGQNASQNTSTYLGGGTAGGTGGAAVSGNSNVTWALKGYRGGALV
jgi:hypothetical protein